MPGKEYKEEALTDYQVEILKAVVKGSIRKIDYNNPGKDLGGELGREDVLNAMRGLEDKKVVRMWSSGFLFFKKSFYEVNQEEAKKLYDSLNLGEEQNS